MSLDRLVTALATDNSIRRALDLAAAGEAQVDVAIASGARPVFVAALARGSGGIAGDAPNGAAGLADGAGGATQLGTPQVGAPLLVVTATGREAEDLVTALRAFLPRRRRRAPPELGDPAARAAQPAQRHRRPAPRRAAPARAPDPRRRRRRALSRRRRAGPRGAAARRPGPRRPRARSRSTAGDERRLDEVVEALAGAAYTRTDLVERRGEFAVRGGILDVFPPTEEHPLRVEFWGDTVEEIRWFTVADQRSLEVAEHGLWAPPCRELLLTDAVRARAADARRPRSPASPTCSTKLAAGHRRRGHGVARARPWSTAWSRCSTSCPTDSLRRRRPTPSGCAPAPTTSSRPAQEFLEAELGQRRGRQRRADRPAVGARHGVVLDPRRAARARAAASGCRWWTSTPSRRRRAGRSTTTATIPVVTVGLRGRAERSGATPRRRRRRPARAWSPDELVGSLVVDRGARPGRAHGRGARRARRRRAGSSRPTLGAASPGRAAPCTSRPAALGPRVPRPRARASPSSPRPTSPARPAARASTKDMRRMPSRRRNEVDPLAAAPGRLRRARAARRRPVRRDDAAHRRRGATREYLVLEYAPSQARASPATGSSCRPTSSTRSPATSAARRPTLNKLGGARLGEDQGPRRARPSSEIAGELIRLYAARHGHARATPSARTPRGSASSRTRSRYVETPDQLEHHRRGQGRHGEAGPDGPADLRRRRLRQDRDRGAGGVQGGPGRQAGRGPRADHAAGPAAPRDLRRAVRAASRSRCEALSRFQTDARGQGGGRRAAPTASVDVVIGTHRLLDRRGALQGPRAWSSSTRSSASASSTRSSSRRCAPTSTCSR